MGRGGVVSKFELSKLESKDVLLRIQSSRRQGQIHYGVPR